MGPPVSGAVNMAGHTVVPHEFITFILRLEETWRVPSMSKGRKKVKIGEWREENIVWERCSRADCVE